ncbi:N-alpha-acetyltransferase, catalitic subunit [Komagataella phaffii CBS 7435]|uniref:Catalytic subunit of N-terminal acetyltransferase of the NatC type n=2 Tax=Komagataella phaffii TaxID=460519 RepID=C4R3Y5_KOMPG|nr:Catalytic subunit of N-terminal acetyltransferase of the NatC type [Komagataella phaffii GS115]AOA63192.1 GQ67_03285T0 [Komagataella phaffii]KAI0461851.1 hypothetical protein LJB42_004926 [Komagataella kurtzmanii]CAH2449988.1 N-alpha-acetyltransferase, catalitic subunit [Komagataella phaffii CBS 7435]AOA68921.1 GQ68_03254T0 [Komagataella phaffii GS115]CAY70258.1 Catalytic subunit of N-terminal acetyltransferase of the NatC type [Komagataella phaffii GS115]
MISYKHLEFHPEKPTDNNEINQIIELVKVNLSEPYCIYTYRYFLNQCPQLCYIAYDDEKPKGQNIIAVSISKAETHQGVRVRGYLGMIAVDPAYRGKGIAKTLIDKSIDVMIDSYHCDEIVLETEVDNPQALNLYESFGFIRTRRLFRYYLNKNDAYRLVLPLTEKSTIRTYFL